MRLPRAHSPGTRWLRRLAPSALVLLVAVAAACGGGDPPDITVRPAGTSAPAPSSTASATPTPFPTGDLSEVLTNVKDLVSKYGYPEGTDFAEIRIPVIGVDAKVGARTVGRDGVMAAPAGPADVVWYDLGLWDGMGGAPGEGRNAVFSGHVDYADPVPYANVSYRGQGVFSKLNLLSQGDIIEVVYRGETLRYSVEWRRQLSEAGQTDWAEIWSDTGEDAITLYTCGGEFDIQSRSYEDRIIVRATRT